MKRLRSTFFLLLLAALGGAYLFWSERGPATSPGAVVLLRAPQGEVRRVVLQPANVVLEARNASEGFAVRDLTANRSARLDDAVGKAFWKQIELVQSQLTVQNPENLRQYGLQTPRAWIEIDGRRLEFGVPAPFDSRRIYARGGGQIALVSADLAAKTRLPFSQWRDRNVWRDLDEVDAFSLRNPNAHIVFERGARQWQLRAPEVGVQQAADESAVQTALSAVTNAKISRWLDERGQNAARYALNAPQIALRAGPSRLEIGGKTVGGFAARLLREENRASTPIFEVSAELVTLLGRPLKAWRDTRVAVFDFESIERLEVQAGAQSRVLVRQGAYWNAENKESDSKIQSAALDLLDFAHNLRAASFVDGAARDAARFGLDSPVLGLKGVQKGGAVAFELRFGRATKKLWAQNRFGGTAGPIFGLDAAALEATEAARSKIFGPLP